MSSIVQKQLPKLYTSCLIPFIFLILFLWGFFLFPEFILNNLGIIIIIYVLFGAAVTLGPPVYHKLKYKHQKKAHICPYCKRKNPEERDTCEFCEYPLNEPYEKNIKHN